ncbi:MAG: hypothetical protein ACMUHM_09125, partial [Thermoplasmatota archaeon]
LMEVDLLEDITTMVTPSWKANTRTITTLDPINRLSRTGNTVIFAPTDNMIKRNARTLVTEKITIIGRKVHVIIR